LDVKEKNTIRNKKKNNEALKEYTVRNKKKNNEALKE
jgi:hypothetical protein